MIMANFFLKIFNVLNDGCLKMKIFIKDKTNERNPEKIII